MMGPLWSNVGYSLLIVLYAKVVVEISSFMVDTGRMSSGTSRKFVHIMASCWILFWPPFDTCHWSWRLNVIMPAAYTIQLFYKGAILKDPDDPDVRSLSRSSSPAELLCGPLQFTIVMMWLGLASFMTEEAALMMATLGVGDGIAPIIGAKLGRSVYRIPFGPVKTVEGSVGVFFGTMLGYYLFTWALSIEALPIRAVAGYGIVATALEAISPRNCDNNVIPVGIRLYRNRF